MAFVPAGCEAYYTTEDQFDGFDFGDDDDGGQFTFHLRTAPEPEVFWVILIMIFISCNLQVKTDIADKPVLVELSPVNASEYINF